MPLTSVHSTPMLGIRLEGGQTEFAPGDTVTGCVYRQAQIVSPDASIILRLHGRTKSRIHFSRGDLGVETYRGRFNLINTADHTQTLFQGPLHLPDGSDEQVWPFTITLPKYVDHTTLGKVPELCSWLPYTGGDVATRPLPSTFHQQHSGFRATIEGFVEYFLRAELNVAGQGSSDVKEAVLPLNVRTLDPNAPIADFKLMPFRSPRTLSSFRLIPGNEDVELSFSQKTKRLFGSKKVPTIKFNVEVDFPTVIQLENPNHIPFLVRLIPDWEKSSAVLKGVEQKVRLRQFTMSIMAQTEVMCEGTSAPHCADDRGELDLNIPPALAGIASEIYIPCSDKAPPVDIGKMINLRVGGQGRLGQVGPEISRGKLYPTFKTYNILHTHKLNWQIRVEIAKEDFIITGSAKVTLLTPSDEGQSQKTSAPDPALQTSESWMEPPAEEQAPPSFTQVQAEDTILKEYGNGDSKKM
ncbi:hypothetical protein BGZ61DRAFT_453226 [Ilyonectria robusta]|uniref:uncharacterized protein n=1 Tax=Ilyonectria robusta TaxID=1079257 RepID=UPI001E8E18B6|nr:uncharacterized protein BGZ61DRAFT_453226 [Ilyonectria robusta]KAH8688449.1 hypothetical protein BGZ61DRAFT_453226 [Ilyonectria robusta]